MAVKSSFLSYEGKPVIPNYSKGVVILLKTEGMTLHDILKVIERGYDCGKKPKEGIVERCNHWTNRMVKVVLRDAAQYWIIEDIKLFKHKVRKRRRYIRKTRERH